MWFSSSKGSILAKKIEIINDDDDHMNNNNVSNDNHQQTHRRPAALFVPQSSPTQRSRVKLRTGSMGHGNGNSNNISNGNVPSSPTNGHFHHSSSSSHYHPPSRPSVRSLFGRSHNHTHNSTTKSSSPFRKGGSPWSVSACTRLVVCILMVLLSTTLLVNVYHPSITVMVMQMTTDSILDPPEPLEFQQLQQERFMEEDEQQQQNERDEQQQNEGDEGHDALLQPHDLGMVVAPHLGPLPQRNQQQQHNRRHRGGGDRQRHAKNDQPQIMNGQQRRHRQARFRGQLPQQQPNEQQQDQQPLYDPQQEQPQQGMRMMMMMMRFQAVEHHDNQLLKRNKYGQVVFRPVTNVSQGDLELDDRFLPDEVDESMEEQEARAQRQELLDILTEAGVKNLDLATIKSLPTTEQLLQLYGPGPVIFGEDTCSTFQKTVPDWDASLGPAGLFNTGTNPLAMYLEANCMIEANRQRNHGMRWQVPWGKHMLASRKWTNTAQNDYTVDKKHVMPVIMIRDPYMWMQSLCKHPYATKWYRSKAHCPSLVPTMYDRFLFPWIRADSLVVRVWKGTKWPSLAHLWTDWYQQYYRADYPRLIVRFEDMIYHPRQTIERICKCAGGVLRSEKEGTSFTYVVDSGKWGPAHGGKRTNLVSAMIKYGTDKKRFYNLTQADLQLAFEALDPEMMQIFQYSVSAPPLSTS